MLAKDRTETTPDPVLRDGLYIRRKTSLIRVTEKMQFEEQPLVKLSAPIGVFRVIDGVIVPVKGVAGVVVKKNPRLASRTRATFS